MDKCLFDGAIRVRLASFATVRSANLAEPDVLQSPEREPIGPLRSYGDADSSVSKLEGAVLKPDD